MTLKEFYRIAKHGSPWKVARSQIIAFYLARADLFKGTVVDAGCGKHPWHGVRLDKCKCIGVDLSLSELSKNRRLDFKLCANVESLPLRNRIANLTICQDLVEHLPDPGKFVGEVSRILVPGGKFMVNTPSLYGGVSLLGKFLPRFVSEFVWKVWQKREMPDYPFIYKANTKRAWRRLASDNGLVVESISYINMVPHWFLSFPITATIIWTYGELVGKIRANFLRSYMIIVLRKDSA